MKSCDDSARAGRRPVLIERVIRERQAANGIFQRRTTSDDNPSVRDIVLPLSETRHPLSQCR